MEKPTNSSLKRPVQKTGLSNASNPMERMGKYFKNKLQLMTAIDIAVMFLWIATLLLMLDFIAVVAVTNMPARVHADATAAVGGIFALCISAAIVVTVVARYLQKRRESGKA